MKMSLEHQKEQHFDDIREILDKSSREDVKSMKDESLVELNDDKSIQISKRPIMFDVVSERQADL